MANEMKTLKAVNDQMKKVIASRNSVDNNMAMRDPQLNNN